jgi:large subunit ribosomal protein L24
MKGTKNPKKQRKMLFNAPAHIRHKLMASPLSPELLAQRGVKTLPVRKGDSVRVMRGDHKGFDGKVSRIDLKNYRVNLEGLTREKVDGTAVFVALHPSKIMIRTLNLDDKKRKAVLDRKKPIIKKGTKAAKKAAPKKVTEEEAKPVAEAEEVAEEKSNIEAATVQKKLPVAKTAEETSEAEGGN